jgi:membrane protease YdiL (CAAX protease family)
MLSEKPWRGESVIQFCAALLVSFCLAAVCAGLLQKFGVAGFARPESFGNVLLGTLSFQGVAWALIAPFLRQHQLNWREAFGFRDPRWKHALRLALIIGLLVLPLAWLLQQASIVMLEKIGRSPEDQIAVQLLVGANSRWLRVYLGVFAVAIAPVAEEFIFRGMLFPFIKQLGFPKLAWFGVSFLFALIHLNAATFAPLFVLALVLTWLYEKTDNLIAPIAAHALFNAANLILLFLAQ